MKRTRGVGILVLAIVLAVASLMVGLTFQGLFAKAGVAQREVKVVHVDIDGVSDLTMADYSGYHDIGSTYRPVVKMFKNMIYLGYQVNGGTDIIASDDPEVLIEDNVELIITCVYAKGYDVRQFFLVEGTNTALLDQTVTAKAYGTEFRTSSVEVNGYKLVGYKIGDKGTVQTESNEVYIEEVLQNYDITFFYTAAYTYSVNVINEDGDVLIHDGEASQIRLGTALPNTAKEGYIYRGYYLNGDFTTLYEGEPGVTMAQGEKLTYAYIQIPDVVELTTGNALPGSAMDNAAFKWLIIPAAALAILVVSGLLYAIFRELRTVFRKEEKPEESI